MVEFKPLSKTQILDQTFRIYKENFTRFLTIIAIIQVPVGLLQFGLQIFPMYILFEPSTSKDAGSMIAIMVIISLVGMMIGVLLVLIAQFLGNTALVAAVANHYLGKPTSVAEAYRIALPKLGTVIWAGIVSGIIIMIGFVLLVVPGVIFSMWFCMISPAIVVENQRAMDALSRSKELAGGNLGKIFFVLLALFLINTIVGMLPAIFGQFMISPPTQDSGTLPLFFNHLLQIIVNTLIAPISAIALNLLDVDLRIRKEGFDLEMMAQSLGAETTL